MSVRSSRTATERPGLIFIRNETIDFEAGRQTYFSPFEAFIRRAHELDLPMRYILPVTDKTVAIEDPMVAARVSRVGPARGFLRGLIRVPEVLGAAVRLRREYGYRHVVVRVPEHLNLVLLPLLSLFGFSTIAWLVHDRRRILSADRQRRRGLRAALARQVSRATGHMEQIYLNRVAVVANGSRVVDRYCARNPRVQTVYSTLISPTDLKDLGDCADRYAYRPDRIRLIFAGRISVEKGIDRLFDFFAILSERAARHGIDCDLTLVGKIDDPMRTYLKQRSAQVPDPGRLHILGLVKRGPELWRTFAGQDFFCLLSTAEGTPRVVPEAHAAGLPVAISPEANSDDIVATPDLVLDPDRLEWSADRLLALHADKARYLALRTSVRRSIAHGSLDAILNVFHTLAGGAARPADPAPSLLRPKDDLYQLLCAVQEKYVSPEGFWDLYASGTGNVRIMTVNLEILKALLADRTPLDKADRCTLDSGLLESVMNRLFPGTHKRLTGREIVARSPDFLATRGVTIFGASDKTRDLALKRYREFGATERDVSAFDEPTVVATCGWGGQEGKQWATFFAYGYPKQERKLDLFCTLNPGARSLSIGVGGAVDYFAGTAVTPPAFLHRHGLEWVWRLLLQPRRRVGRILGIVPIAIRLKRLAASRGRG